MLRVGYHLSIQKGILKAFEEALSAGASTFAFFSRNPLGRGSKNFINNNEDFIKIKKFRNENKFNTIIAHSPYIINLCSSKEDIKKYSINILKEDLLNLEKIEDVYYNLHPGFHLNQGIKVGCDYISKGLITSILDCEYLIKKQLKTKIILETMSGKGSEVGSRFEEIGSIIKNVNNNIKDKNLLGVCIDTCHSFDAGYDLKNIDKVLLEFDKHIGLDKLLIIHLNDSKNKIGSKKDRHEKIGYGNIGLETIEKIINHNELKDKIFILETPNDFEGYKNEIKLLKSIYKN